MAQTNPNSHLPYAIRYMARLQELAVQSGASHGLPTDRLQKCAMHLRVTARSIGQANQLPTDQASDATTQKMKLLHFLRQQT